MGKASDRVADSKKDAEKERDKKDGDVDENNKDGIEKDIINNKAFGSQGKITTRHKQGYTRSSVLFRLFLFCPFLLCLFPFHRASVELSAYRKERYGLVCLFFWF
jgi:hypothetical protein